MWESRADRIEHSGPEYVYEQIADDIATDVNSGALSAGSRLPSAQELAEIYGVARLTARRAIKHLEEQRLVVVRPGKGTFVNRARP
jgi:GntR family transcriptional regulator